MQETREPNFAWLTWDKNSTGLFQALECSEFDVGIPMISTPSVPILVVILVQIWTKITTKIYEREVVQLSPSHEGMIL